MDLAPTPTQSPLGRFLPPMASSPFYFCCPRGGPERCWLPRLYRSLPSPSSSWRALDTRRPPFCGPPACLTLRRPGSGPGRCTFSPRAPPHHTCSSNPACPRDCCTLTGRGLSLSTCSSLKGARSVPPHAPVHGEGTGFGKFICYQGTLHPNCAEPARWKLYVPGAYLLKVAGPDLGHRESYVLLCDRLVEAPNS